MRATVSNENGSQTGRDRRSNRRGDPSSPLKQRVGLPMIRSRYMGENQCA